jgi:hypothetical protein
VVEDLAAGRERPDALDEPPGGRLAAEHEHAPREQPRRLGRGEQRRHQRRHDLDAIDPVALEVVGQRRGVRDQLVPDDVQVPARRERREDGRVGEVCGQRRDGREGRGGREREPPRHGVHVVRELPVLDGHALGPARRARRVEDVGQALRPRRRGAFVRSRERRPRDRFDVYDLARRRREPFEQARAREHDRDARVFEHEGEPFGRLLGLKRHVRAARLPDGEHADDGLGRAFEADADAALGAQPRLAQARGQTFGARVQLAVGQRQPAARHRVATGREPRLLFDQLVDEPQGLDRRAARPVELDEQPLALFVA